LHWRTESGSRSSHDDADVSSWGSGTATIAYAYLHAFNGVTSEADVVANKSFDAKKVEQALSRVEWRQSVPRVGGRLWSNLVLAHPLPNANHRSATALLSLYLRAQDDRATLAAHIADVPEMDARADAFFATSKRLLTVRRNARQFSILKRHGVTEVERKGNVVISLDEYNLGMDDPYGEFADAHGQLAAEFIRDYLVDVGLDELAETADKGKHALVQALTRS
jgi:prophage maintenance system killer protein